MRITIDLRAGDTEITMWTCDYSYDYIRINADYRT
ncbi:MAG: bifunctional ornithine acetyltransferase/N-acetylglutamate synthase [Candidatus Poribacteria bacterium]|nr:bifunctional ornithine acetyltransferase/N-acetylglutamate synthase [Candidatus Poribacteria bacterium]